tara:strand:- start:21 stop:527 length:507 start_codon:yes stop_codon:yes gene_type:complete
MKKEDSESTQNQSLDKVDLSLEEQRISFSANLISCLENKKKSFNKEFKSNIKIDQIKNVYERGVSFANEELNLNGLARVNMFLRLQKERKSGVTVSESKDTPKISELTFEDEKEVSKSSLDISADWSPTEEDFSLAKEDTKEYDLNFEFKDLKELYLESYQPIQFYWN